MREDGRLAKGFRTSRNNIELNIYSPEASNLEMPKG